MTDTKLEQLAELRAYGHVLVENMAEALKVGPHEMLIDIRSIGWDHDSRHPSGAPWCWCRDGTLPHKAHLIGG